jgi:uncharacterized protein (DUF697 family)
MKATNHFLKINNPFKKEYFNFLEKNLYIIEDYVSALKRHELDEKDKKNFLAIKKEIKKIMIKISEENSFMQNCTDELDLITEARNKSKYIITTACCIGFCTGFIPIPFADMGLIISLSFLMIRQIANEYGIYLEEVPNWDLTCLVLGIGASVVSETGGKITGKVAESLGEKGGKQIIENFTEQALKYEVVLVNGPGNMKEIIGNIAEPVLKESYDNILNKGMQFLWNNSKTFKETVKNEIIAGTENFVTNYANKLINNPDSVKCATEVVIDIAKERGETLQKNCIQFLSKGAGKTGNIISHLCPIINCFLDSYTTYTNGKSAIKYFEEYIRKSIGIKPILKRKKDYEDIFKYIEARNNV